MSSKKRCVVHAYSTNSLQLIIASSSKLDLLVRVRYSNPLPCPPKLLNIPTNPMRYAKLEFLYALANETPLPMIVDAECGMPLDLGKWECLWTRKTISFLQTLHLQEVHIQSTPVNLDRLMAIQHLLHMSHG